MHPSSATESEAESAFTKEDKQHPKCAGLVVNKTG